MDGISKIFDDLLIKLLVSPILIMFAPFKMSIVALLIMIIIDTLTGTLYAIKVRRATFKNFKKVLGKLFIYFASIITVRLVEIGIGPIVELIIITHFMVSFLVLTEAMSILRNLTLLGAPLPAKFIKIIMGRIKSNTLEELLKSSQNRQEYLQDIVDMINYQIPNIKSDSMRKILQIKFEEWANTISLIDLEFSEKKNDSKDLLFYRLSNIFIRTNGIIKERWREEKISEESIDIFYKWHKARMDKWMESISNICYSDQTINNKQKQVFEKVVILLSKTILDIQKCENGIDQNICIQKIKENYKK